MNMLKSKIARVVSIALISLHSTSLWADPTGGGGGGSIPGGGGGGSTPIPEPSTWILLGMGIIGIVLNTRKSK